MRCGCATRNSETLSGRKARSSAGPDSVRGELYNARKRRPPRLAIIAYMTYMTVTYELQQALKPEQFRALGKFANTYGLQCFRLDEEKNLLHFDYDASRLREVVVEDVLRRARIPVLRRVPPTSN